MANSPIATRRIRIFRSDLELPSPPRPNCLSHLFEEAKTVGQKKGIRKTAHAIMPLDRGLPPRQKHELIA